MPWDDARIMKADKQGETKMIWCCDGPMTDSWK